MGSFFVRNRLRKKIDEQEGEDEADQGAANDLADTMTYAFFEARKFRLVYCATELLHEHIEIASLISENHPDTDGIIDDEKREEHADGERPRVQSFEVSDRYHHGNSEGSMHARHMAVGEEVFRLPPVLQGKEQELDDLRDKSDRYRDEENEI